MNLMMKYRKEEWEDIPNYEGLYQVSNLGRVKSFLGRKPRILKQSKFNTGYLYVCLSLSKTYKNYLVHQLVAMAFLNHKPSRRDIVIDHIDNDKTNNFLGNLQVVTQRENLTKNRVGRSSRYAGVHWNKAKSKWISQIQIKGVKKHIGCYSTELEAHIAYKNKIEELNTEI